MAPRLILAFSGGLGAGKSLLTKALEDKLKWKRASFGEYVRDVARTNGLDATDRGELQRLGQALVLTNLDGFIEGVLKQVIEADYVILDGIRHIEVLLTLRKKYVVKLVHLEAPSDVRQERYIKREHVERRLLARYEQDITEAQISRILPQYADLVVDATWPLQQQVDRVADFARQVANLQPAAA